MIKFWTHLVANEINAAFAPQVNLILSPGRAPLRMSSSPKKTSSGFRLNYDNETPLHRIDIGGSDQELKCLRLKAYICSLV